MDFHLHFHFHAVNLLAPRAHLVIWKHPGVLRAGCGTLRPLPTSRTMRTSTFPKIAKFQLFLMNRWFNVINKLDRATGTQAPHWLAHHQPQTSVCTYSGGQCPCGGCGALPQSPADSSAPCTSSCASSTPIFGTRSSSRTGSCTVGTVWRPGSCRRRTCEPASFIQHAKLFSS